MRVSIHEAMSYFFRTHSENLDADVHIMVADYFEDPTTE